MMKNEGSGIEVEAWIRGTVCCNCQYENHCNENPFDCSNVLNEIIKDECVRRAINEAEE